MLVLLQGIIHLLDNEVKLSRMESFSSPSITFPLFPLSILPLLLTSPNPILSVCIAPILISAWHELHS